MMADEVNMSLLVLGAYVFSLLIKGGFATVGIIGYVKLRTSGWLLIMLSTLIEFLYHLPSIYTQGVYASLRMTPAEYGASAMFWSVVNSVVHYITALMLLIGIFLLLRQMVQQKRAQEIQPS